MERALELLLLVAVLLQVAVAAPGGTEAPNNEDNSIDGERRALFFRIILQL